MVKVGRLIISDEVVHFQDEEKRKIFKQTCQGLLHWDSLPGKGFCFLFWKDARDRSAYSDWSEAALFFGISNNIVMLINWSVKIVQRSEMGHKKTQKQHVE